MTQAPVLSLILCSRNDAYMGNSLWRLVTALEYVAQAVADIGRQRDVEVIVADWGSEAPLRDATTLTKAAAAVVSFLHVPPATARALQGDSPFPEVLALNAAARRARGRFVGRIDQDTLAGARFLTHFLGWADGAWPGVSAMTATVMFANRRSIPYRLASRCPPYGAVARFIANNADRLAIETSRPPTPFYHSDVGVWLTPAEIWHACTGYDERMLFMNDMEVEMTNRLLTRYPMFDLGAATGYDFYHLDHYHPRGSRRSATHRRVNEKTREPRGFAPNGEDWGLGAHALTLMPARASSARRLSASHPISLPYVWHAGGAGARTAIDRVHYGAYRTWRRRAERGWTMFRDAPLTRWPSVAADAWRRLSS